MFHFSLLLALFIFTLNCSNVQIDDNSEYLFENPELITKADFLEAFHIDTKALNRSLSSLIKGCKFPLQDPFSLYIMNNYFGIFREHYPRRPNKKYGGHFIPLIWKRIYNAMLNKVQLCQSGAFKLFFGFPAPSWVNPHSLVKELSDQLLEHYNQGNSPFKDLKIGETQFAVAFAFLIWKILEPSDKYACASTADSDPTGNSQVPCLYGYISPSCENVPQIVNLPPKDFHALRLVSFEPVRKRRTEYSETSFAQRKERRTPTQQSQEFTLYPSNLATELVNNFYPSRHLPENSIIKEPTPNVPILRATDSVMGAPTLDTTSEPIFHSFNEPVPHPQGQEAVFGINYPNSDPPDSLGLDDESSSYLPFNRYPTGLSGDENSALRSESFPRSDILDYSLSPPSFFSKDYWPD